VVEWFDDLAVGMRFKSPEKVVTREEIKRFASEFDPQPYHLDEAAAEQTPLKGLAASGWHTAAIAMRLAVEVRPFGPHPLLGLGVDEDDCLYVWRVWRSRSGWPDLVVYRENEIMFAEVQAAGTVAKAKPGQLNYGSAGVGTATHLAGAYFAAQTNINIVHVPYTVSSNIISDMLSGAIQASFDPLAFVLSFLQNGSLRALAVGADEPVTDPIKIPSAIGQGVDYHFATWYGILAPVKTPKPALRTLADAIAAASRDGELLQKIKTQGIKPDIVALDAFDSYIDATWRDWRRW
jgi:Tripartite tricarboxylate transporter family receptor/MaoC like domain